MAGNTHVEDLIPFYVLGALDAREVEMVEEHLPTCEQCRALWQELREGVSALPYAAAPIQPSPRVKQQLLARVQADLRATRSAPQPRPAAPRHGFFDFLRAASPVLALASFVLFILAAAWALSLNAQVEQLRALNQVLAAQINQQAAAISVLSSPGVVAKNLQGTPVQPNARGSLHADLRGNRALLVVSGLKPLPAGRVYEVWLIKGQTPVGVGTFTVDANGAGQILINTPEAIGAYQIAALTEEPSGGSPLPTSDVLMAGQF